MNVFLSIVFTKKPHKNFLSAEQEGMNFVEMAVNETLILNHT